MTGESDHSDAFYEALLGRAASGLTVDQLAHNVLALAVYIVAQFTHGEETCYCSMRNILTRFL